MITRRGFLKYIGGLGLVCVLPGVLPVEKPWEILGRPLEILADPFAPEGTIWFLSTPTGDNWFYHYYIQNKEVQWKELEWKS